MKGESLDDTVETLSAYKIDMIVVRDRHAGVPRKVAAKSGVSGKIIKDADAHVHVYNGKKTTHCSKNTW